MDTPPISGFITRKQAAERCQRNERTLQRDWSRAMEHRDMKVLEKLKLHNESGEVIEGPEVSKELIDRLKKERKVPTWYVDANWVEKRYGPRLTEKMTSQDSTDQPPESERKSAADGSQVVAMLREQVGQLQQDKQELREELKIKNEQINQASERDRETHVLMRDLHELLRDMQKRLPAASGDTPSHGVRDDSTVNDAEIVTTKPEKGAARPAKKPRKKSKPRKARKRRSSRVKQPASFWHRDVSELLSFRKR